MRYNMELTQREKNIIAKSEEAGWNFIEKSGDYFILTCPKEHRFKFRLDGHYTPRHDCVFCRGKRHTEKDFRTKMQIKGCTVIDVVSVVDTHGNTTVRMRDKVTFMCSRGHEQTRRVYQCLQEGSPCTACKGTVGYTGYSRSEEIISRVLTYHGVEHLREYKIVHEGELLRVDFYIPSINTIIEYDGKQHKIGRPKQESMSVEERTRRDNLRDEYARLHGVTMIRIDDKEKGNRLIQHMAKIFPEMGINPQSTDMIDITREVYNQSAEMFGWTSYDELERISNMQKQYGIKETMRLTGLTSSPIGRAVHVVRGKSGC